MIMKKFLKWLFTGLIGLFITATVFGAYVKFSPNETIIKWLMVTDNGTSTGNLIAWLNTGGRNYISGYQTISGMNGYVPFVNTGSFLLQLPSSNIEDDGASLGLSAETVSISNLLWISFSSSTAWLSLVVNTWYARFSDNRPTAYKVWLEYTADYSWHYTSRSLVDKWYIDGKWYITGDKNRTLSGSDIYNTNTWIVNLWNSTTIINYTGIKLVISWWAYFDMGNSLVWLFAIKWFWINDIGVGWFVQWSNAIWVYWQTDVGTAWYFEAIGTGTALKVDWPALFWNNLKLYSTTYNGVLESAWTLAFMTSWTTINMVLNKSWYLGVGTNNVSPESTLDVLWTSVFGNYDLGNYTKFDSSWFMLSYWEAIVRNDIVGENYEWSDVSKRPTFVALQWWPILLKCFDDWGTTELFGRFEKPHNATVTGYISPHLHRVGDQTSSNTGIIFFTYQIIEPWKLPTVAVTLTGYITGGTVQWSGRLDDIDWDIYDSWVVLWWAMVYRVWRDADLSEDTYPWNMCIEQVGLHYRTDRRGSKQERVR